MRLLRRGPITQMNKIIRTLVGADLSRPAPIIAFNKLFGTSVGADLSCPPPIYRPQWIFRYPDYSVNVHYRAQAERVGFEPTRACTLPLFESGTFDHSDISPRRSIAYLSGYSKHNQGVRPRSPTVGAEEGFARGTSPTDLSRPRPATGKPFGPLLPGAWPVFRRTRQASQ